MKIQHYCYTRGKYLDYCDWSYVKALSGEVLQEIRGRILAIMNDLDCDLNTPKWVLVKIDEFVVWGICCWNRLLSDTNSSDYTGTPVYGFFAVIITDTAGSRISLPFDINYFKELYRREVAPYWDSNERHENTTVGYLPGIYHNVEAGSNNFVGKLNNDPFRCRSLGGQSKEPVIAAALLLERVSLLIDNDNMRQATDCRGPFMNCLSPHTPFGEYSVKRMCPKCKTYVTAFSDGRICQECKSKEVVQLVDLASLATDSDAKKEKKMENRWKEYLDGANRQIEDLNSMIEYYRKQLKRKEQIIKILTGIIVVLAFVVTYLYSKDSLPVKMGIRKDAETISTSNRHENSLLSGDSCLNLYGNTQDSIINKLVEK